MSTIKCLMTVELLEVSSNYIFKLRESHKNPNEVFELLPEFTLRGDGKLIRAENYLQFIGLEEVQEPEKYLLINLLPTDHQLDYEIGQTGAEDLFKDIDFKSILNKTNFKPNSEDSISKHAFLNTNFLIVELCYTNSFDHYSGGEEWEMEIDIVGFLSGYFSPQYFD